MSSSAEEQGIPVHQTAEAQAIGSSAPGSFDLEDGFPQLERPHSRLDGSLLGIFKATCPVHAASSLDPMCQLALLPL